LISSLKKEKKRKMTKKVRKEVQLVVKQSTPHLGKAGNLVLVKSGYARNYLIPQRLGELATQTAIRNLDFKQKELEAKEKGLIEACIKNKSILEQEEKFIIQKRIGNDNKIFGKITLKQIREVVESKTNVDLTQASIEVPEIKELGTYTVSVFLHPSVKANIKIEILPQ
jgi:large subunit ribosomal protein L9